MTRIHRLFVTWSFVFAAATGSAQIAGTAVLGRNGMVVTASPSATAAGVEILKAGGTAVDAAVAVGFALAVTLPEAGNLGGGGFFVAHLADRREVALDFRETAPKVATADRYLDAHGAADTRRSREGGLAAGVPGSVAGLCEFQKKYGTLPLKDVMAPAIRLAREGWPITQGMMLELDSKAARELLRRFPESKRIFLDGAGKLESGQLFVQPELAHTLALIAEKGPDVFYRGEIAELIVAEMERCGGAITRDDLAAYQVKERTPLIGSYRGHRVVTMPPPSSGGIALIEMLNLLEDQPIGAMGFGSERATHVLSETMRRAFRDRYEWLGDPDFAQVPARGLTSKAYAALVRPSIGETATVSSALRMPDPFAQEKSETTHFSVVDGKGNAVACTTTLNGGFGSGVTVTGAGFLLNNEMDDFAVTPGVPNMFHLLQGDRNKIAAGKRPLSSMTPTILLKDDRVVLVAGSPGGPTIINTVLQVVVNVVDHGMTVSQAVAAPRIHHQWMPDQLDVEPFGLAPEVIDGLARRGHKVVVRGKPGAPVFQGDAQVIARHGSWWAGAADPRHEGQAAGY